jgi:hypothetical protein
VLSPLLFLIYVNDIPLDQARGCRAGQFADDVTGWTSARTVRGTFFPIQRALDLIGNWCSQWRIKLNVNKTQLVSFKHTRMTPRGKIKKSIKLYDKVVEQSKALSVVGVNFGCRGSLS